MYIPESQKKLVHSTLVQYEVERSIFWIPQQIKIIMPGMKLLTLGSPTNRVFHIGTSHTRNLATCAIFSVQTLSETVNGTPPSIFHRF